MKPHEYRVMLMMSWFFYVPLLTFVLVPAFFKPEDLGDGAVMAFIGWQTLQVLFSREIESQPDASCKRWGWVQLTRYRGIVLLALFPRLWSTRLTG